MELERLSDIEARLIKTTPGPWMAIGPENGDHVRAIASPSGTSILSVYNMTPVAQAWDADFIVNAQQDIRLLLNIVHDVAELAVDCEQGTFEDAKYGSKISNIIKGHLNG